MHDRTLYQSHCLLQRNGNGVAGLITSVALEFVVMMTLTGTDKGNRPLTETEEQAAAEMKKGWTEEIGCGSHSVLMADAGMRVFCSCSLPQLMLQNEEAEASRAEPSGGHILLSRYNRIVSPRK